MRSARERRVLPNGFRNFSYRDTCRVCGAGGFTVHLREFQQSIEAIYGERDRRRGRDGTFRWLVEEVGELARAMRDDDPDALRVEIADVLAWTASVASLCGLDVEQAAARYARVCPKCHQAPCGCAAEV